MSLKEEDGSNPINYQPLSLLNTDYKIFTRLLSTLIQDTLATGIRLLQQGFVPHRVIHTTIDLLSVAKQAAVTSEDQRRHTTLWIENFYTLHFVDTATLHT